MPGTVVTIPRNITVHLGYPTTNAQNVTLSFIDYIKNVASSEIYPTWDESALRANILAQISFALNRVYTEYYRSRGYNFDITSSTAIDQAFVNGRNIFSNISILVDNLFNDYIRRIGFIEPLAAKYCNGTTVTCDGLSQWGSENLAQRGYDFMRILRSYYGDNIEIVYNARSTDNQPSYPGTALRVGSTGQNVVRIQVMLNRISRSYPSIPKISPVDGIFGPATENAVRRFQSIFNLAVDGIVGKSSWYQMVQLYVGLQKLSELNSQGQRFDRVSWNPPNALTEGDTGEKVSQLQYMLSVVAEYNNSVPTVPVTGTFGSLTRNSVLAFQRLAGLPQSGIVGASTWNALYDTYSGIAAATIAQGEAFPTARGSDVIETGSFSANSFEGNRINMTRFYQNPGYDLRIGMRDERQGR